MNKHNKLIRCIPELQLVAIKENKYPFCINDELHREHVDVYYGYENNLCSDVQHIVSLSNAIRNEHPSSVAATNHVHFVDKYLSIKHEGKTMVSASISIFDVLANPERYQAF